MKKKKTGDAMKYETISYYEPGDRFSPEQFGKHLTRLICEVQEEKQKNGVLYLCIGSDRSTGDSLGPLIGYLLEKNNFPSVVGTLQKPVHAVNLEEAVTRLEVDCRDNVVVAIDASVGQKEHIGCITLGKGAIKPGLGVKKDLVAVGDIFITGIVGSSCRFEPLMLQNTRLSMVMELADCISRGIQSVENFLVPAGMNR